MARRRRRSRRRRGRGRGSSVSPAVYLVPLALAVVGIGGYAAWAAGLRIPSPSGSASGPDSGRFTGAAGVSIPGSAEPEFWWTTVSSAVTNVDAQYLPGFPTDRPMRRVTIPNDLLFAQDSFELSSKSLRSVEDIAATITNASLDVIVVCHSSADGPVSARQPLSLKRANALASKLEVSLGRPRGSIGRIGKGDTVRLEGVSQDTPTGRALHRRCEVFVEVE